VTRANTDLKRHLLIALAGAVLFTCESWALGRFSWIYAYCTGLEVIPSHLALSKPGQNFSLWAPFIAGGLDRLSFLGNADPFNGEPLFIRLLPVWGKEDGFLVIANTWNPYCKARIDGEPAALMRTNHAQCGLLTPKNAQLVRLRYEPPLLCWVAIFLYGDRELT
jgi:hypothetical protein